MTTFLIQLPAEVAGVVHGQEAAGEAGDVESGGLPLVERLEEDGTDHGEESPEHGGGHDWEGRERSGFIFANCPEI